jgi:hypothetical protein
MVFPFWVVVENRMTDAIFDYFKFAPPLEARQ